MNSWSAYRRKSFVRTVYGIPYSIGIPVPRSASVLTCSDEHSLDSHLLHRGDIGAQQLYRGTCTCIRIAFIVQLHSYYRTVLGTALGDVRGRNSVSGVIECHVLISTSGVNPPEDNVPVGRVGNPYE
eukprot:COSAG02_NODE_8523_length_2537_cov_34.997539_4_plen_127_part_00